MTHIVDKKNQNLQIMKESSYEDIEIIGKQANVEDKRILD